LFVMQGGVDLITESPILDCNHKIHNIRKGHKGWETMQGHIHVCKLSMEVIWKNRTKMFRFDSPALFHDLLGNVPVTLAMLQQYIHKTAKLEKVIKNVVSYTSDMLLDPKVIHETLTGLGEGIGSTVKEAGSALEHLIITEQAGFRDGLNTLLSGPVQLIFNILIVLIILVVLGYVAYLIFMARCNRARVEYVPPVSIQRSNSNRNSFGTALVRLSGILARRQKIK